MSAPRGRRFSDRPQGRSVRPWPAARRSIVFAAGVLGALGISETAAEQWSRDLPGGRTLTLHGQFSPTTLSVDDGVSTYSSVRDNAHATTRLGFDITRTLGERTIRWSFESGFGIPTTSGTSQTTANARWAFGDATVRKAEVRVSGPLGVWSLGQGETATDGVATQDLSGTAVAGGSAIRDDAGSFQLRSAETGELTGIRLGDVFENFDGGQRIRLRYDSPRSRGYSVSVAAGLDDFHEGAETFADAAIRYERDTGTLRIRAAAGLSWQREGKADAEIDWIGSISAHDPETGVSVTASGGYQVEGGRYLYLKAGYRMSPFGFGDTMGAADLFLGQDFESRGSRSRAVGLQLVQSWDSRNIEAYLGLRRYSYEDADPGTYRDAHSMLAGMRWRF